MKPGLWVHGEIHYSNYFVYGGKLQDKKFKKSGEIRRKGYPCKKFSSKLIQSKSINEKLITGVIREKG